MLNELQYLHNILTDYFGNVIIYIHAMFSDATGNPLYESSSILLNILNANNEKTQYTYGGVTYDFTNSDCKVGTVICGHLHDYKYQLVNNINVVALDDSNFSADDGVYYYVVADFDNSNLHIIEVNGDIQYEYNLLTN